MNNYLFRNRYSRIRFFSFYRFRSNYSRISYSCLLAYARLLFSIDSTNAYP
jgi:hypothetical protein